MCRLQLASLLLHREVLPIMGMGMGRVHARDGKSLMYALTQS